MCCVLSCCSYSLASAGNVCWAKPNHGFFHCQQPRAVFFRPRTARCRQSMTGTTRFGARHRRMHGNAGMERFEKNCGIYAVFDGRAPGRGGSCGVSAHARRPSAHATGRPLPAGEKNPSTRPRLRVAQADLRKNARGRQVRETWSTCADDTFDAEAGGVMQYRHRLDAERMPRVANGIAIAAGASPRGYRAHGRSPAPGQKKPAARSGRSWCSRRRGRRRRGQ